MLVRVVWLLSSLCVCSTVFAQEYFTFPSQREALAGQGLSLELVLTVDNVNVASGGLRRGSVTIGNIDFTTTLDFDKAGLWEGGTLFSYVLGNFNFDRFPSEYVGDSQVSSNIETVGTVKLYELWYEHSVESLSSSILIGLHDYNSEFYVSEFAGAFLNSSFGIGIDTAQVGPSIFASTSLAARIRLEPIESAYVQAALYDGTPGSPYDDRGTQISLQRDDGVFSALEFGYRTDPAERSGYRKLALGGWFHSTRFEDFREESRNKNYGMYVIFESSILCEDDGAQGLGAFVTFGRAPSDRNEFGYQFTSGLSYVGILPDRDEDELVLGIASARLGGAAYGLEDGRARAENAVELSYRIAVTPFFSLQPDLQYIVNPGNSSDTKDATVISLRTELAL